ncbi:Transcriptional regulatory protein AruR [uncultured Gammaproteobacteria bacterium]
MAKKPTVHIAVVEDEPATREALVGMLEQAGYQVSDFDSAGAARLALAQGAICLLLLDLNLPDGDGMSLIREFPLHAGFGIIIISARSEDIDRVLGLELGADDYVTKPFVAREVLARVRAALRRITPDTPQARVDGVVWRFSGWALRLEERQLLNPEGTDVRLTRAEFDLLVALVSRGGRVLNRDQLLDAIGSRATTTLDRTIDVLVGRIRRKIETSPKTPAFIITVAGIGYKFVGAHRDGEGQLS